jgi:hypothetical protein
MTTRRVNSTVFACHQAACRPPTSGGTGGSSPAKVSISHIRGDIRRERKAISKELDAQGIDKMNPLRHIFETWMGDQIAVVRDNNGAIVGGVQYDIRKRDKTLRVTDMRMLQEKQGHGTKALESIAQKAVEGNLKMHVDYALESAKPFYAKLGAVFQKGFGHGEFSDQARDALAKGQPIPGHPGLPYEEWIKVEFGSIVAACHSRACAPPPTGKGGSDLVGRVRSVLTDDLRKAPYKGHCNPMTGHCYVASEALYHALGGKQAGYKAYMIKHEGSPHWFLRNKDGEVIDPTADQFKTPVPYDKARAIGFLTSVPSKRAREVLRRLGQ